MIIYLKMNILITGAAQGIGAAIASHLANSSNSLILVDLNKEKLAETANLLRPQAAGVEELAGDLTDSLFTYTLGAYIAAHEIDVLINNAAVAHPLVNFTELTEEQIDLAYKLNIKAPFHLIQAVLPGMQARERGTIINVASRANIYGYAQMGVYAASKAALTSFSGTVAIENPQLKSITIIPGRTNTPMQVQLRGQTEADNSQSPDYVGQIVAEVVQNQIEVKSGDHVLVNLGEYSILSTLEKSILSRQAASVANS